MLLKSNSKIHSTQEGAVRKRQRGRARGGGERDGNRDNEKCFFY